MLDQLKTSIRGSYRESEERLVSIESIVQNNENRIDQSEASVTNITTRINDQSYSVQQAIHEEGQVTRAEVRSLRDDIFRLVTAREVTAIPQQEIYFPPSSTLELQELTAYASDQLAHSPRSLQQPSNALNPSGPTRILLRPKLTRITAHKRRWECSLILKLVPFVQKTAKFTIVASFGTGGASIGQNLSFFNTVQRAKSPAFILIDSLVEKCTRILSGKAALDYSKTHPNRHTFKRPSGEGHVCYQWDLDTTKVELDRVYVDLCKLFDNGYASPTDRDEVGNSLLHVSYAP